MDIAAIRTALVNWVRLMLDGQPVVWMNDPRPMQSKLTARVELDGPHTVASIGQDWRLWEEQADGEMLATTCGNREFTVTVRVVSRSQVGNNNALTSIERLRVSLRLPSVAGLLREAQLGLVNVGVAQRYDVNFDGRIESIHAFEVRFSYAENLEDVATSGRITHARITSVIEDQAGQPLPDALQMDNTEIP